MAHTRKRVNLAHGLTSTRGLDLRRGEMKRLIDDLICDAPHNPDILATANALAESVLLLEGARREKGFYLQSITPDGRNWLLGEDLLCVSSIALKRIDELERRALSRRNRLMNRLDYLIVEAKRTEARFTRSKRH